MPTCTACGDGVSLPCPWGRATTGLLEHPARRQAVLGLRSKALRSRVNQTCTALSAWKVKFIPSPAPLGSVSVACADVPWRCLFEILHSAQQGELGLPRTGSHQSLAQLDDSPASDPAQPMVFVTVAFLIISFFSPLHSYFLSSVTNLFPFTLLSAEFTPIKALPFTRRETFLQQLVLGKIHHQLPLSLEPKDPKEVPFFDSLWLSSVSALCCKWSSRNDCQCIISECNYVIIYPLKEYNPPLTTYMRKTTWNKLWMW